MHRRWATLAVTVAICGAACSPSTSPTPPTSPAAAEAAVTTAAPVTTTTPATTSTTAAAPLDREALEARVAAFLAAPDVASASLLAVDLGTSGDQRWVPWLVDLLQVIGDIDGAAQVMVALQTLTGQLVVNDLRMALVTFGGWVLANQPDPGPGYPAFKRALFGRFDPSYDRVLAQVADPLALTELVFSAARRGAPPTLEGPDHVARGEVGANELVTGVVVDGEAVAYPRRLLAAHPLLADHVGGKAVLVAYSPLGHLTRVFEPGGRRWEISGLVRGSNELLVDEGDTLYQQLDGTPIGTGRPALTELPATTLTWADWLSRHPGTTLAVAPGGGEGEAPLAYDTDNELWFPAFPLPGEGAKAPVIGVTVGSHSLAIDTRALGRSGPTAIAAGDITVIAVPAEGGTRLYRGAGGLPVGPVTVARADSSSVTLANGQVHPRLDGEPMFWFLWHRLHPTTARWPP